MAVLDGHQHRDEKRHNLVEPLCVGGGGGRSTLWSGGNSQQGHTQRTHTQAQHVDTPARWPARVPVERGLEQDIAL